MDRSREKAAPSRSTRGRVRPARWSGRACAVALLVGCAAWPSAARAQARELAAVSSDIERLGAKLQNLIKEHRDPSIVERPRRFSERLTDAEIMFLLADYNRASLLLFDLAGNPANEKEPLYDRALYYLAESQFQMRNDRLARSLFERIVGRRTKAHLTDAIKRLIEIADRTRDWQGVGEQVELLRKGSALPPSIAYIHSKSQLRQGKLAAVATSAGEIAKTHPLYGKARYLVAVAAVQAGRNDEALQVFGELTKISDDFEDAVLVRDLARMNIARIQIEQGHLAAAVDSYQDVSRNSPYFEESLYEITWTYVRSAAAAPDNKERDREYGRALKALEILLLSETSTTLAPEARILLGNILLRLRRFDEASNAFSEVVERYEPVREELSRLAVNVSDPVQYYDEIAQRTRSGGGLLPPLAIKWAAEQHQLKQALGVVQDLDQGETWITESQEILDKLLRMVSSEERTAFFPALHEAQANMMEIDSALITLNDRLLAVEREIVARELDDRQSDALDKVLAERAKLDPAYRKLPQRREDFEDRLATMRDRMQDLQKHAFRLKWDIEQMRRTLGAVRDWFVENGKTLPKAEVAGVRSRLDLAEREVVQLERTQVELEAEIARERNMLNITSKAQAEEDALRQRYVATLDQEQQILSAGEAAVTGDDRALLAKLKQQRELLVAQHVDLEKFRQHLNELVSSKAYDIKAELLKEQGRLVEHAEAIAATRGDAKRVVGEIAVDSLKGVEGQFRAIVLRGDVGIVDVAWARKEEKTHQISRRVNEQHKELAVLDAEFQGIMQE